jgi:NADH:ubiquinone oxidoreductase subunit 5 (subunit L)/multisubunit Na+/H+ antiporter MnhA subunit
MNTISIIIGLALMAAIAPLAGFWRRSEALDLGFVSARWLAEYRQGHDW